MISRTIINIFIAATVVAVGGVIFFQESKRQPAANFSDSTDKSANYVKDGPIQTDLGIYVSEGGKLATYDSNFLRRDYDKLGEHSNDLVAINSSAEYYAYIDSGVTRDRAWLRSTTSPDPKILTEARHDLGADQEVKNQEIKYAPVFSFSGNFVSVKKTLWEGCDESLYNVADQRHIVTGSCGFLVVSPNEERIISATAPTLSPEVEKVFFSNKDNASATSELVFKNPLFEAGQYIQTETGRLRNPIIAFTFLSDDELAIIVRSNTDSSSTLLVYRFSDESIGVINRLPEQIRYVFPVGRFLILVSASSVFNIQIDSKQTERIDVDFVPFEDKSILGQALSSVSFVLFFEDQRRSNNSLYAVDLNSQSYREIFVNSAAMFAGLAR